MFDNRLEPEYQDAFKAWQDDPSPAGNAAVLKAVHPLIEGAVKTHVGAVNPLLLSRARRLTLDALRSYDPKRARLSTHVYNQLQGLKRVNRQQTQILKVPERVSLSKYHLDAAERELRETLGRDPTDEELFDHTGFSEGQVTRLRGYRPGVAEGTLEDSQNQVFGGLTNPADRQHGLWQQLIYGDLDAHHQKVMELSLGLHGREALSNSEIARRMNRSPGAISQAKLRIQKLLDQEHELSPFGG